MTETEAVPDDDLIFSANGSATSEPVMEDTQPLAASEPVSTVGNVKVGLELLKKGRLALDEVPSAQPLTSQMSVL